MSKAYTNIIENSEETPEWHREGFMYLLSKRDQKPKNYRPITCLQTMYKILTSIIAESTLAFLTEHQLLLTEQKGCQSKCHCRYSWISEVYTAT